MALSAASATKVLCVGLDPPSLGLTEEAWRGPLEVLSAAAPEDALDVLGREQIAVLVVGDRLPAAAAARLLEQAHDGFPGRHTLNVVLSGDEDLSPFQQLIDRDRIYYLSPRPISSGELLALVRAAMERYRELTRTKGSERSAAPGAGPRRAQRLLALARQIGTRGDAAAAGRSAVAAIRDLLDVDHAGYLIYDAREETLWAKDAVTGESREESAVAGLCSFVVRTAEPVAVPRADRDPRYDAEADNPDGDGSDRLMAVPILGTGRRVLAVLVAARGREKPEFTGQEQESVELVAEQLAYALGRMELQSQVQRMFSRASVTTASGEVEIFRREALEQQRLGHQGQGELLQLSPRWIRHTYRLVLAFTVAGLAFLAFGRMTEYAEGPALVRADNETEVVATAAGAVDRVMVQPGQRVSRGEVLVRFHDVRTELERTQSALEPGDPLPEPGGDDPAETLPDEPAARAPHAGVVSDLRVHPGQQVAAGERLLSLTGESTSYRVVAMLPGRFRPRVRAGGPLRLKIQGYEHVYEDLEVERVGDVVGAAGARRFLGLQPEETRGASSPVVLVEARLSDRSFDFAGEEVPYFDGMVGTAHLELGSESLLISLVPGLRTIFRREG